MRAIKYLHKFQGFDEEKFLKSHARQPLCFNFSFLLHVIPLKKMKINFLTLLMVYVLIYFYISKSFIETTS